MIVVFEVSKIRQFLSILNALWDGKEERWFTYKISKLPLFRIFKIYDHILDIASNSLLIKQKNHLNIHKSYIKILYAVVNTEKDIYNRL